MHADVVVLAAGHRPPSSMPVFEQAEIPLISAWDAEALRRIPQGDVLLLGTGLTTVDIALSLSACRRRGTAKLGIQIGHAGRKAGSDIAYLLTKIYSFGSNVPPSLTGFVHRMLSATPIDVVAEFLPTLEAHDKREALETLCLRLCLLPRCPRRESR